MSAAPGPASFFFLLSIDHESSRVRGRCRAKLSLDALRIAYQEARASAVIPNLLTAAADIAGLLRIARLLDTQHFSPSVHWFSLFGCVLVLGAV